MRQDYEDALAEKDRNAARMYREQEQRLQRKLDKNGADQARLHVKLEEMQAQHMDEMRQMVERAEELEGLLAEMKAKRRIDEEELRTLDPSSEMAMVVQRRINANDAAFEETQREFDEQTHVIAKRTSISPTP